MARNAKDMIPFSRIPAIVAAWAALTGAALVFCASPAFAFSDSGTGFGLNPPAGFSVEPTTRRQFDIGVGIESSTGKPAIVGNTKYVCEAGFKAASQNNALSRNEINRLIESKEWINLARATLELVFQIDSQSHFTLRGYRGIEFQARPKSGPGAENVRMTLSMIETAKGRVTVVCGTTRAAFRSAVKTFRAIRSGVVLPE